MKILITGGNGFIARSLFEELKDKYNIASYNSKDLNLLDSSKVFDCIKENKFDIVIHTATYDAASAFSTKDPAKVLENNLRMFFNIARCRDYFGKMIYFGSGAEFNRENWIPGMKEDYFDQHVPSDQYGFSKYLMAKYTELNSNIYNLRLFGVFGKYDDWRYRFIPNACVRAVLDLPITINRNKFFDYLYIDDLVKIVSILIKKKIIPNKHYNVCTGKTIDLFSLSKIIIKISGKKLKIKVKKKGFKKEYSGDNGRLIKTIGNFKFNPIEYSVSKLYRWYQDNIDLIDIKKI